MVEVTREQLDEFMSKTDFDFSTVAGWREFLNERREGGAGRDADGFHARDIKNYPVGIATIITNGGPVNVKVNIRTMGSGLALPPGVLYVFHPDRSWKYKVSSFYVGPPGSSIDFSFQAGGAMTNEPNWGTLYYIVVKSGELPGRGAARIALNQYLRA
jgi:hypothetical protein